MPQADSNRRFFIQFGIIALALHALIAVLAVIAWQVGEEKRDPVLERVLLRERIEPVAQVVVSQTELERVARLRDPVPQRETAAASGEDVVSNFCAACHAAGVLGAPVIGDEAEWQARLQAAGGIDGLLQSAIEGIGQMPPRGGAPQLGDEQLRAAIEAMLP
ncbi:MAG: c-type cytochrome [Sinimarinibacterium flocculans]|uniref:c-type cytochrome n=1 Tax=Sinimarinibacterium flocculans TaxID=985250 RepID=UPI003C5432CE